MIVFLALCLKIVSDCSINPRRQAGLEKRHKLRVISHLEGWQWSKAPDSKSAPPLERDFLAVGFMGLIHAAKFQVHPVLGQIRMDPTGGLAFLEDVTDRRQINEMNAAAVL